MNEERLKTAIQIGILFILPVILLITKIIALDYRPFILGGVAVAIMGILIFEKWSLKSLGLRLDNIRESLSYYSLLTVAAVITIILLAKVLNHPTQNIFSNPHFKYGFIIVSFLQEFLFRLATISHSLINFIAVFYCFASFGAGCT